MTDYMLMVLEDESAHASRAPKERWRSSSTKREKFVDGLRAQGQLRDSGRLRPSKEGKRVRPTKVEDGPFAGESKALGSYYLVQAESVEEAGKIATSCPVLPSDEIDVRPLMKGKLDPDKEGKPGKIFACAVLGNAPNEEAWVGIMDRIDADTSTRFPESMLGGVRLQPPKTGKRVARHAMFDGPFLESKEVIGGVFFMRMASIEEAVEWANTTRFVELGALEIRELWRT